MPNLKDKFKYGDVIMFRPTGGFVSKMISLIDGSEYSHGAIFWKYDNGVPLFIESHEARGGVVINKLQEWSNFDVYRAKGLKARPINELLGMVGRRYDYSLLWWIFKTKILRSNLQNNDNTMVICTELVDFCYYYTLGAGYVCTPNTISNLIKDKIFEKVS
jgi:hypothetical protein